MIPTLVWIAAAIAPLETPTETFALVVGNNLSDREDLPPLRYADDDAAKYYELFAALGEARLLTLLDADSQQLFTGLASSAQVPSKAALQQALDELFAAIRARRAAGARTAFYFVYSGHGGVAPGMEGYLYLGREKLSRGELMRQVVAASPAHVNHLLIDACNAYYMVQRRGAYPDDEAPEGYAELVAQLLRGSELEAYPNTGAVLSTSAEAETHEWSHFGAGVFSHELRSGLLGAADVDLDGQVRYDELAAFVAAANARVQNPRARVEVLSRPPAANLAEPLLVPGIAAARGRGAVLQLEPADQGRIVIEDSRGVRHADLNKAPDRGLGVLLLAGRGYFVRGPGYELEVPATALQGTLRSAELARKPLATPAVASRGAVDQDFLAHLFAVPFSMGFYEGHRQQLAAALPSAAPRSAAAIPAGPGFPVLLAASGVTLGLGALAGVAGGVAAGLAASDLQRYQEASLLEDRVVAAEQVNARGWTAIALGGAGAALLLAGGAGVLWALLDNPADQGDRRQE